MTDTGDEKEAGGAVAPSKAKLAKAKPATKHAADGTDAASTSGTGSAQSAAEPADQFNRKLREVYSDVLDAPVPDRFLDLLAQLDAKSAGKGKKDVGETD